MSVYLVLVFFCHYILSHSFFNNLILLPRTYNFFVVFQSPSNVQLFETPWAATPQDTTSFTNSQSLPKFKSITLWCHPTISSSITLFSFCLQSFPASESFRINWLCASGGQSIGASASAVLPMSIQGWFSLRLTGLISLLSKRLSRIFSSTTVWKHQFFSTLSSLWSSLHSHVWLLGKP